MSAESPTANMDEFIKNWWPEELRAGVDQFRSDPIYWRAAAITKAVVDHFMGRVRTEHGIPAGLVVGFDTLQAWLVATCENWMLRNEPLWAGEMP